MNRDLWLIGLGALLALCAPPAHAERVSDVASTRHNLSTSGPGPVKATAESQICVFCHTPHGAETVPGAPLWNRQLSGQTYTTYLSSSIQANVAELAGGPGGTSKLCLSCHDGAMAIGAVNVASGQASPTLDLLGTAAGGTMPAGEGTQTGFTRNLGVDLTNDHPISFTYDSALALADGELRDPAAPPASDYIGAHGSRTKVRLENGEVECATCHDPHIRENPDPGYPIKFLRLNRFQQSLPTGTGFSQAGDIVCLACHDKLGLTWAQSAHASAAAAETYKSGADSPAALREFPSNVRVWEAACLNCHDTHTVQGARRLLREGTDALGTPRAGGAAAIEQVCYQCHTTAAESILADSSEVPDIKSDFLLPRRMPIASTDQPSPGEVHDIADADFTEPRTLLGWGNAANRHAECTDCHNPHRVLKNRLVTGTGATAGAAHEHATGHTNLASGALRGAWGVEPQYASPDFQQLPSGYFEKRGDPGSSTSTAVSQSYVTREYQICLKCHSDYGYTDSNVYPLGTRPDLGGFGGGTPSGTNGLTQYTNQAKEFQAPTGHRGEGTATGGGGGWAPAFATNNHRSWHPVLDATGRSLATRGSMSSGFWEAPWDGANVGTQTMYCSDCHGSNATGAGDALPDPGRPWGPHGSTNDFILKGTWNNETGTGAQATGLCFKCHDYQRYANAGRGDGFNSGFGGDRDENLHGLHNDRIGRMECTWCHVAVPHGWKNKALLANLNDIGPEAGQAGGVEFRIDASGDAYTQEPYYLAAKLKIRTFRTSGNWSDTDCGSSNQATQIGAGGNNTQNGADWMKSVCANPP